MPPQGRFALSRVPWWAWAGGIVLVFLGGFIIRAQPKTHYKPWQQQSHDVKEKELKLPCQHCTRHGYREKMEPQWNL